MSTPVSTDTSPTAITTAANGSTVAAPINYSTEANQAIPGGSLSSLPGGSTVNGTSTVIPQAILNSVGSTQVTSAKVWIAGALILLVIFAVIWFAYDKAGSVIDIVDNVSKKL